jgi:hypothetical protein
LAQPFGDEREFAFLPWPSQGLIGLFKNKIELIFIVFDCPFQPGNVFAWEGKRFYTESFK